MSMTREYYLNWIATRGPAGTWDLDMCRKADALIKRVALETAKGILAVEVENPAIRQFVYDMLQCHFGTVEVDNLLMKLKAYPDWMDKSKDWS